MALLRGSHDVNINGVWRNNPMEIGPAVNINGVWRECISNWVNINGVWRNWFEEGLAIHDIASIRILWRQTGGNEVPGVEQLVITGNQIEYSRSPRVWTAGQGPPQYEGIVLAVLHDGSHVDLAPNTDGTASFTWGPINNILRMNVRHRIISMNGARSVDVALPGGTGSLHAFLPQWHQTDNDVVISQHRPIPSGVRLFFSVPLPAINMTAFNTLFHGGVLFPRPRVFGIFNQFNFLDNGTHLGDATMEARIRIIQRFDGFQLDGFVIPFTIERVGPSILAS